MDRQLAAILFSDIVGYTSMMGENEAATLELVRQSRELQKRLVEKHQGVWLKEMGDGAMAQFKSALDAVRCAIEIQKVSEEELKAQLRIGIHLGDITVDNDEIYGDGVNVASRIESIADPGSVYISEAVQGAIKGSDIKTDFRGEKRLKNVQDPVRVYKVLQSDEVAAPAGNKVRKYSLIGLMILLMLALVIQNIIRTNSGVTDKTIAVLPLQLVNPDSSNQYLVQGITEELIRSIGKIRELTVINPISTLRFMASMAPVKEASNQLDQSDYFLSGSFEENNNLLKLNISLFDRHERELWNNSYNGDVYELPKLAGTIAIDLAEYIHIELDDSETARIVEIPSVDPEMFKLMLLGKMHLAKFTPEDIAIGLNYLQQAVDKDPTSSQAWSSLAEGLIMMGHGPAPPQGVWDEAKAAATRALQLDSLNAEGWAWLGTTKTYYHWDYQGAQYCYAKANSLNPNLPMSHYHYSWHLYLFDSLNKAVDEHEIAFRLDPLDPFQAARLGHIYLLAGKLDSAMMEIRRSKRLQPDFVIADNVKGQIHMIKEEYDSAELCYKKTGIFGKGMLATTYLAKGEYKEGMSIIHEMETNINPYYAFGLAVLYAQINDADKFFEYANYPQPHAFHPWLRVAVTNPQIIEDPRFKELMDKMNLPMPGRMQEQLRIN